jgi:aryl-alcohol dehydrogenase-like predicted oxidoreductase
MEYRPLRRAGVQVSKLCLGTMSSGVVVTAVMPRTPSDGGQAQNNRVHTTFELPTK